jgi:tRNA (guanine37-N1)-methyltransferase
MKFHIITLFPESFSSYLNESILARAQKNKLIDFEFYNPRDFSVPTKVQAKKDKPYLRVDDKPYGGGPGMVMQALPVIKAIEKAVTKARRKTCAKKISVVFLSPSGKQFDTQYAKKAANKYQDIIIVCGRYEGIDQRVVEHTKTRARVLEVSIGDYVLNGGEVAAMVMVEAITRLIPGFMGNAESIIEESHSDGLLEYPSYTKPSVWRDLEVPAVLLSGHHGEIEKWRKAQQLERTKTIRPDLLD